MDFLELMRTLGALAVVLGLLAAALWVVKRYNIALPGRVGGQKGRRLELVERLSLDGKRSAVLLRGDGREHLVLLAPEGNVIIETRALPAFPAPLAAEAPVVDGSADQGAGRPSGIPSFAAFLKGVERTDKGLSVADILSRLRARTADGLAVPHGQKVH